ncbi:hypothetical protein F4677DRAFT_440601 [Hypoxylon crocopeplum]|nr:hypothetical protein F4677DRAFT_440601 [Hypoxylon crocopeplum]
MTRKKYYDGTHKPDRVLLRLHKGYTWYTALRHYLPAEQHEAPLARSSHNSSKASRDRIRAYLQERKGLIRTYAPDDWVLRVRQQASKHPAHTERPKLYSFKYYDVGRHRVARSQDAGILIDSSSRFGAVLLNESDERTEISGPSGLWAVIERLIKEDDPNKPGGLDALPDDRDEHWTLFAEAMDCTFENALRISGLPLLEWVHGHVVRAVYYLGSTPLERLVPVIEMAATRQAFGAGPDGLSGATTIVGARALGASIHR